MGPESEAPATPTEPAARPPRPGGVTAAGVLLITVGSLIGFFGLAAILIATQWESLIHNQVIVEQLGNLSPALGRGIAVAGMLLAGFGVLELVCGIYALRGRSWARIAGLVVAGLAVLFFLQGSVGGAARAGAIVPIVLAAANAYVVWGLATNGAYFAAASRR